MDDMKWYFIFMIVLFVAAYAAVAVESIADSGKYEACIAHHEPAECEDIRD